MGAGDPTQDPGMRVPAFIPVTFRAYLIDAASIAAQAINTATGRGIAATQSPPVCGTHPPERQEEAGRKPHRDYELIPVMRIVLQRPQGIYPRRRTG